MNIATRLPASDFLHHCRAEIDQKLANYMDQAGASQRLQDTMRYGLLGGGKRIRPALCLAAAEAVGGQRQIALAPACALEMIHAYSLMHDDLPAMDDDDLRRGRATAHIAFDESSAILAGDALQAEAFRVLATAPRLSAEVKLAMIKALANACGANGMVGGQAIDLESVARTLTLEQLENMHRHKTGALIEASVHLGALAGGVKDAALLDALARYARALGLAFQVQDDLLDIEGDTEVIGKTQGSDIARGKPTYPALLGPQGAREHLARLLAEAHDSLKGLGIQADALHAMADYIVARSH
ncbi:geranyl transferase [Marinobacter psychrophilus]|uniref:Geranyl transferase n=1 Tax=Marinobacter psychrophilus TaxID=330734 RepID=A0A0H4I268_9GAMM|nr:farnesyl diphosphate synthase [Marinobacter psychrophilus]AKO51710.1 geranyl transferase [Marinobacter psychrophilus]